MRRMVIAGALLGVTVMAARTLAPRLHARMLGACQRMFEQMPDDFPPRRMLRGIEEIRANTARTLELIEERARLGEGAPLGETRSTRAEEVELAHA